MTDIDTSPLPVRFRPRWQLPRALRVDRDHALSIWRTQRTGLVLFAVFGIFLALVQFSSPDLPDYDGFYHIRLAYLMRTEGLKPDFPWLPLTILNQREFYDHHFLLTWPYSHSPSAICGQVPSWRPLLFLRLLSWRSGFFSGGSGSPTPGFDINNTQHYKTGNPFFSGLVSICWIVAVQYIESDRRVF